MRSRAGSRVTGGKTSRVSPQMSGRAACNRRSWGTPWSFAADLGVGPTLQHGEGAKGDRGDDVWLLRVLAQPGGMRFDGVEFLRADTHRGWEIASMARGAARWARFS
jgi:hypothetical protein